MKRYWISRRDDAQGPYATDELQMMLRTGEIQTSDQVRVQDGEEGVVIRELLRNKPSALQKEWARHQSRQAGFAARCLLAVIIGVWTVPAMRDVALMLSLGCFALAATLIAIQFLKGDRSEARRNLVLAFFVTPLICLLLSRVIS